MVFFVGKVQGYLEGTKFQLYTDNSSLQWLRSLSGTKSKLMHWAFQLAGFDLDVFHVPGVSNQGADSISRHPVGEPEPDETEPLEREIL